MRKRITISLLVIGALAFVAAAGAFTYRSVYAQTPTPTTPTTPSTPGDQSRPELPAGEGFHGERIGGEMTDQYLADALGITTDQLKTAYQTATADALKEAVSQGLITQAQSDQITANGGEWHGLRGLDKSVANGIDFNALLAKALGITTDQLQSARLKAESARLDAAVQSGAMTQEQADLIKANNALRADAKFQSSMKSAFETAVKQAVADGLITQAQADQIIQNNASAPGFMGHGFGGFDGMRGGKHGGPGFNGGQPGAQNNDGTQLPSTTPSTGL